MTTITKRQAREALNTTDSGLSKALGITHQAVSQWPDDGPIPQARAWQLMALYPGHFPRPDRGDGRGRTMGNYDLMA